MLLYPVSYEGRSSSSISGEICQYLHDELDHGPCKVTPAAFGDGQLEIKSRLLSTLAISLRKSQLVFSVGRIRAPKAH
jgi:hypothetical protein